jgi:hypothetical protein
VLNEICGERCLNAVGVERIVRGVQNDSRYGLGNEAASLRLHSFGFPDLRRLRSMATYHEKSEWRSKQLVYRREVELPCL